MPKVVAYKAPTGAWGKPLSESVKEDVKFERPQEIVEEENEMVALDNSVFTTEAPNKKTEAMRLWRKDIQNNPMLLKPIFTEITENWGDMEDSDDEDYQEYDSMGRPMEDNSAW